jgi:CRP-like cAMP-binding protein
VAADKHEAFDYRGFTAKHGGGSTTKYAEDAIIYARGDPPDTLFYLASGAVKVTVISEYGKEAVVGILRAGDFFGEGCLDSPLARNATITATADSEVVRIDRTIAQRGLQDDAEFAKNFMSFLLQRNQKLQSDLLDQLFNSSEKRLARILLILANSEMGTQSTTIPMALSQETLATMVGTTRSRINQFMNKFRRLGYIDYNSKIEVRNSLMNLILDRLPQSNDAP